MQTNRLLLLGAAPVFLTLLVVSFLAFQFAANERTEQAWVLHTYQVMDQARKIFSHVQDAETGQRGYLLTRKESFLSPYKKALSAVYGDVDKFKALTTDNPSQQLHAGALRGLIAGRFAAFDRTSAVTAGGPPPSPELIRALETGRKQMDAVRAEVSTILAAEQGLLRERILARHMAESREIIAAFVATAIAFLILLTAALLLVRGNIRLSKTEADRERHAILLQATLDNIRDGVAVFDEREKLVAFNSNFFGCMGYPSELAIPGTPLSRFEELAAERKHPKFTELPFVTGGYGAGYSDITFDNRNIEIYRNHVSVGGFLVACLDVTQRVHTEAALRQAQKMETVGQLTGGVAHDFNNLLQVIGANLDLLAADVQGNAQASGRLQGAITAVERGSRLTGQLLAFARRQTLAPRATNLARLLQEMSDLLRRTLGERVDLETVVGGGLWNTLVDQGQLENAILNLAINARDAMPDGGKLTIELANAYLDEDYAKQHADVTPGQYAMVAVTDTGMGMPADVAARAFEPFFTTKPEGRGTGLGLSQVYGFVKQTGGHVKIYSELGEGTTIKLYLPRSKAAAEWSSPSRAEVVVSSGETVLVVEDDEAVRAAATDMLTDLGYAVLRAENAERALAILKDGAKADVLFTDVVMPGPVNTRDLARQAKEILPGIKVLFTSGYTRNAIVHNGRLDDDVELLSKPYRKDELARKLRHMLHADAGTPPTPIVDTPSPARPSDTKIPAGGKVLIVEDTALIRMAMVDMVTELGHGLLEAGNAPDALSLLEREPDIDVLLTDLNLPGMSGTDLVHQARKLRPELKVVVASGFSGEDGPAGRLQNVSFLQKPFTLDQLRAALEEA